MSSILSCIAAIRLPSESQIAIPIPLSVYTTPKDGGSQPTPGRDCTSTCWAWFGSKLLNGNSTEDFTWSGISPHPTSNQLFLFFQIAQQMHKKFIFFLCQVTLCSIFCSLNSKNASYNPSHKISSMEVSSV